MKILVPCKIVPDDQDIVVTSDGTLDFSKAHQIISTYDLNALEAAAQLAATIGDAHVVALSVGPSTIDDAKVKKNILARGIDELYMIADDQLSEADAYLTASALFELVQRVGDFDLIICGDGSADMYAQQVDIQLASLLGVPGVNGVISIKTPQGSVVEVERLLEDSIETIETELPAVVSVVPDIALPRLCGMKDILAAGKKPQESVELTSAEQQVIEVIECRAPQMAARKQQIVDGSDGNALAEMAATIKTLI